MDGALEEVEKDQTSNVLTDVEILTVVTPTNIVTQLMVIIALFILVEKQKFMEELIGIFSCALKQVLVSFY